jgi:hypothetical protein
MKYCVFLLFIVLIYTKIVAQDMSIEFSIEWKDQLDFQFKELKDGNIRPAYLNITYRNISDKPLYCLKIVEGKAGLPEIQWFFYDSKYPLNSSFLKVNDDYFNRRYFVGFKSNPYYNPWFAWDVRNDTTDIEYKIIKETRKRPVYDILIIDESTGEITGPTGAIGGDTATLNDWIATTLNDIIFYILP